MADVQIQNQNHQLLVDNNNHKFDDFSDNFHKTLTLQSSSNSREINDDETLTQHSTHKINEEEDEFEFCFFGESIKSPVSAEEVFEDGQIRIISPFSGDVDGDSPYKPPVNKLFVVSTSPENDDVAEGSYCVWESPSPTPEMSKKSNSTGFSKLWKVRDLLSRSNSDGKDAYVFLKNDDTNNNNTSGNNTTSFFRRKNKVKLEKLDVRKRGGGETEKKESCSSSTSTTSFERKENNNSSSRSTATTSFERKEHNNNSSSTGTTSLKKKKSAYEVLYGENKKKGSGGGKSYLPYKVGFFTNGSGLSRNVHPY